jgi:hypothetical protein
VGRNIAFMAWKADRRVTDRHEFAFDGGVARCEKNRFVALLQQATNEVGDDALCSAVAGRGDGIVRAGDDRDARQAAASSAAWSRLSTKRESAVATRLPPDPAAGKPGGNPTLGGSTIVPSPRTATTKWSSRQNVANPHRVTASAGSAAG